jgi:myxalamid-type polyketide synthase MxaE and MxaD
MQAALWGAGRVLAEELPTLWGGAIDVDPAADAAQSAREAVRELLAPARSPQRALRDGHRFQMRLREVPPELLEAGASPWRADGAYLITGGLGAIGLRIAEDIVARGARRLLLAGRHGLPPRLHWRSVPPDSRDGRRIAAIRQLEARGAAVHVLQVDVGDASALRACLDAYAAEQWPPIVGIIHAAGIIEDGLVENMDRGQFQRVIDAKLTSALHLDALFPDARLFVMFSSIGALLGWAGIANYAAANAGLDALAQARRARGAPAQSIQWGPWRSTGMLAGDGLQGHFTALQRQGIGDFTPEQGVQAFGALTAAQLGTATVMPVDPQRLQANFRGRHRELFEGRFGAAPLSRPDRVDSATSLDAAGSMGQRRLLLEGVVREAVSRVLGLAPQRLDPRRPLGAMGLNSLLAMEVRNHLELALGRTLSASLTWNYPTIEQLVRFLNGENAEAPPASPTPASLPAGALRDVASLSDEEAARELLGLGSPGP